MFARLCVLAVVLFAASHAAAAVLMYEGFDDLDATDGQSLSGVAGDTSVGFGPSSTWTNYSTTATFQSAGLTFSTLPVTGGSARVQSTTAGPVTRGNASRPSGVNATGTIFGSFLVSTGVNTDEQDISAFHISSLNQITGSDNLPDQNRVQVGVDSYNTNFGSVTINGDAIVDTGRKINTGTAMSLDTTYLVLFKFEGLIGPSDADAPQTITNWVLTTAQYNAIVAGGITESELNSSALQTGTITKTDGAIFTTSEYYILNTAFDSNTVFDELRIATTLNEAIGIQAVPEPGSIALALCGLVGFVGLRRRCGK